MHNPVDALAAAVARHAAQRPHEVAFTALSYSGRACTPSSLTFDELHSAAGTLAGRIGATTVPGDRIAILCEHGLDYVVGFLACLYAARIAVPLFPVDTRRNTDRLAAVLGDADPVLSLVSPQDETRTAEAGFAVGRIVPVSIRAASEAVAPTPVTGHPAYLQYTSGSTKSPAGVEVTHANLAAALNQLRAGMPAVRRKPMVNWLPFFHDMGLVFTLSLPLYTGVTAITLPAAEFAKRPIRWLRACSDYGAGTTASPNFGLTLAVSGTSADERADLDLSGLDLLLNGSEPVRAEALAIFTRTFAPHGFRHAAHTAGYGLAEATLPVTFGVPDRPPTAVEFDRTHLAAGRTVLAQAPGGIALVGCGPAAGQQVRLVHPTRGVEVGRGEVGEIWVRGPNVCAGYFRRPRDTADTFGAHLPGHDGTWLRTGDLGFLHDGELYIAGRLKDMIVVAGRNHYPADIEATAGDAAPEVRTGHLAAFGVDDGVRETLVVVAELDDPLADPNEVRYRIRSAITSAHDIVPAEVVLVERGQIPKTSSGKIRRGDCRARYRTDGLIRIAAAPTV